MSLLEDSGTPRERVTAIGSHGQTLRHRTDISPPFTWQIGDPNTVVEMTGITVVGDFRRRDIAAGGQGAPLVPVFHDQAFRSETEDRAIINIGGIANLTVLRRDRPVLGFDTGPGNRLLDAWISRHQGVDFDHDGRWAAGGRCDTVLLQSLLEEPYLSLPAPKSTGRELFNLAWLDTKLRGAERNSQDVHATLLEFTAQTIAAGVRRYAPGCSLFVCGGGAHNTRLLASLARLASPNRVATTAVLGLDPDYVEAIAFAWFARRTLSGLPSSAASVTGAAGARILGGIYHQAARNHLVSMHLPQAAPMNDTDLKAAALYINRELSFLEFNQRVLEQAKDRRIPLLERVKFLCISCANLDEFFEIRVASLKELIEAGASQTGPDGMSAHEQLKAISARATLLVDEQYTLLNDVLMPELAKHGVVFLSPDSWSVSASRVDLRILRLRGRTGAEPARARSGAPVPEDPQQELELRDRRRGRGRLRPQQRPRRRPGSALAAAPD